MYLPNGGDDMKYRKEKLNAMRFFLAQTSDPGIIVRERVINLRGFRTDAAKELFSNPFSTDDKAIYVLGRLCDWADVIFPDDWEDFATPSAIGELANFLQKKPYNKPEKTEYTARRVYLQMARVQFEK